MEFVSLQGRVIMRSREINVGEEINGEKTE